MGGLGGRVDVIGKTVWRVSNALYYDKIKADVVEGMTGSEGELQVSLTALLGPFFSVPVEFVLKKFTPPNAALIPTYSTLNHTRQPDFILQTSYRSSSRRPQLE